MLFSRQLNDKQISRLCYQTSIAFKAGLPLTRIFGMIQRQFTGRKTRKLVIEVHERLEEGNSFTTALSSTGRLPRLFLEFVAAAELSGQLEQTLVNLTSYYDRRVTIRRTFISALILPALTCTVAYGVVLLLAYLRSGIEAVYHILLITLYVFGVIAAIFLVRRMVPSTAWVFDFLKTYVPVLKGIFRRLALSRFTRTLALMIGSGVGLPRAVDRAAGTTSNLLMEHSLRQCLPSILEGENLADSFSQSRFVTPFLHQMMVMADETGKYDEALMRVANIYETEAQSKIDTLPKVLVPTITVILGIIVLIFAYRFYNNLINQALSIAQ